MDFTSLPLLGAPLAHVETYVYFDGPRTFALRSTVMTDLYYVVNTVDEDEDAGILTTLVVAVSGDRFRAMRSGVVRFRDVFTEAPAGSITQIDWAWQHERATPALTSLLASDLPDAWLPTEGARLSLPTATVEPYQPSELLSLSQAQGRTIFAVEVEHDGSRITEFPARYSGALQIAVDGAITSLARETVGSRKTAVVRELQVSTLDLKAASFVVMMGINSGGVVEPNDITAEVFERFSAFLEAVASDDTATLIAELKKHTSKTRNRLRDILKPLAAAGSGIRLSTAIAYTNQVRAVFAGASSVRAAVDSIEVVEPEVQYVDVRRGALTGLVLRTQRFEIADLAAGTPPYRGHMTADATAQANGLTVGDASFVTARIRVETPFTNENDETAGVKYILESITPFEEPTEEPA